MKQIVLIISFLFTCSQNSFSQTVNKRKALTLSTCNTVVPLAISSILFLSVDKGRDPFSRYNESRSTMLSFGYYGIIIGPSAGHFYAHNPKKAFSGILIRSAVIGLTYLGAIAAAMNTGYDKDDDDTFISKRGRTNANIVLVGGHLICLGFMVDDIFNAKESVDKHNKSLGLRIIPNYDPIRQFVSLNVGKSF